MAFVPKLSKCHFIVGRRWNSSFATLFRNLKAGEPVDPVAVEKALATREITPEDIAVFKALLDPNNSEEAVNQALHFFLPHDFSLYFALTKARPAHVWNDQSLLSLLESNPGRVFSLADLLKKHGGSQISDKVRMVVLDKLLRGEKSELRDGEFQLTDEAVNETLFHLNKLPSIEGVEEYVSAIVDHSVESGNYTLASNISLKGYSDWLATHKLSQTKGDAFLNLAEVIFNTNPQVLRKHVLAEVLALEDKKINSHKSEFFDRVLKFVIENKLDLDKRDAESLLIRIQLMETYGINMDAIDIALEKFHHYQSHEKLGIELVQTKLVQAFCYQSFAKNDANLLKIAEALMVVDELPVRTIAHLILASSRAEGKDLEIYNEYINKVSKKVNKNTRRSPSGLLTEAMMIASLYGNDREFAQLLYEKAIQNKIISDEMEIASLKKVFTIYGQAFADDSWETAEPRLALYVLESIKRI